MRRVSDRERRERLERLPGVDRVEIDPDDPDWDFRVYKSDGDVFDVTRALLAAGWDFDDYTLINQLEKRSKSTGRY